MSDATLSNASPQVPKRTTYPSAVDNSTKPVKAPSKYVSFGTRDSHAIETVFQRLAEAEENAQMAARDTKLQVSLEDAEGDIGERHGPARPKRRDTLKDEVLDEEVKVPVNEDYLFDVDIRSRELSPVYWLGPSYDVRRGTWFYQGKHRPSVTLMLPRIYILTPLSRG